MKPETYAPGAEVGPLEDWRFDNPSSAYVIERGDPQVSGRIDAGGPGYPTRRGIWACTMGAFTCTEQGDEMMTILSGSGTITDVATGTITAFKAGDTLFTTDGMRVTWDVTADVVKAFFGYKATGF